MFHELSTGLVSPKFHARRDGNRVFYATSTKEMRRWLPATGAQVPASFFKRYALLAIFYRTSPGARPDVTSIGVSPPVGNTGPPGTRSTLVVGVTLYPLCPALPGGTIIATCPFSIWSGGEISTCMHGTCSPAWGVYLLEAVDKSLVPTQLDRVVVTESVYVPPPRQCPPCVIPVTPYPLGQ